MEPKRIMVTGGRATLEHRWAQVTVAATFLNIMAGGLVNPTDSSLACPEAFVICRGEFFPAMVGGVLFEHGHRLTSMVVGLLQLGLTAILWRRRPSLRRWAVLALALVVVQALLGALTVHVKLHWAVSTAHLMVAMTFFAITLLEAWRTRPLPPASARPPVPAAAERARLRRWVAVGGVAVLLQILLGGLVRHLSAVLASVDLPLHEGQLWPADAPLALQLHIAHRLFGVVVGLTAIVTSFVIRARARREQVGIRRAALLVPLVVLAQITLGVLVILTFRSVPIVVAHFGGAALLWGLHCAMWLGAGAAGPAPLAERAADELPARGRAGAGALGGGA